MSPAKSQRQKRAMAAEYGRRKKGGKPRIFKGMSMAQLREFIVAQPKKGRKKTR